MRYIKIPETMLPVEDDILVGDYLFITIGVSIDEPALYGYNGLVTYIEPVETNPNLPEEIS